MQRGAILGAVLLATAAVSLPAQIIDSGRRAGGGEPIAFTSLSIGWLQHGGLCDPDTNSCWDFGSAPQFRVTLEMPMGRGASVGIAGTTAKVPLTYIGGSCGRCDADANVSQLMANLRLGAGSGFHQVIDANAGITLFSSFRDVSGTKLPPDNTVTSFTFTIGYGFGYAMSERLQVMLVQDYGLVIHKRIPGDPNNTAQQSTTRIGVRYGLGTKGSRY